MKNKRGIILSVLLLLLLVCGIDFYKNKTDSFSNFDHITPRQILMQNKQNYFVYFYKKDCPYCKKIEKDIIKFSSNKKNKVYFVDVSQHKKDIIQYDWVDFHTNNDIEIGKLTKSGKVKYYKEFSKNYFKNNKIKNKFDKTVEVKIITADKEYKKQNKNAKSGYVYASIQTPEIDYSSLQIGRQPVIAGVPTLLEIRNKEFYNYYFDSPEIKEFLKNSVN